MSNNHTVKLQPGETTDDPTQLRKDGTPKANAVRPLTDMCDDLQGRYPKDFKFTGWHPHCRCHAVTILKTEEEMAEDTKRILAGEKPLSDSVNEVTDVPEGFTKWIGKNSKRIDDARKNGTLPYFIRDNQQRVTKILEGEKSANNTEKQRIQGRISEIIKPQERAVYVSFEPFSPFLREQLSKRRDKKNKLRLFAELLNDESFNLEYTAPNGCKTVVHPGHKTKDAHWLDTLEAAHALNKAKRDVIFLPEADSYVCADALTLFNGVPRVVDFKYCTTTKYNTLQKDLTDGFIQADTIVLKLESMDLGQFKNTIEYLKRNNLPIGNIILINHYNEVIELTAKHLRTGRYLNKIRGFL